MSIVVAVAKSDRVVMASDVQSNFGSRKVPPDNQRSRKIRRVGGSLLGRTGWSVYENILDDLFARRDEEPDLGDAQAVFRFFTALWKELHSRYAFVNDQSGRKNSPFGDLGGSFLVANRAGIHYVSRNTGVSRFEKYFAIGSGADFALGALHQLYDREPDPEAVARSAVETASALNAHCGAGIDLLEL